VARHSSSVCELGAFSQRLAVIASELRRLPDDNGRRAADSQNIGKELKNWPFSATRQLRTDAVIGL